MVASVEVWADAEQSLICEPNNGVGPVVVRLGFSQRYAGIAGHGCQLEPKGVMLLAATTSTLGINLSGRLDHDVEALPQLLMSDWSIEVELWGQSFKYRAHAYPLLGGEAVPVVVSIVTYVCMEGFSTVVVRHLVPFSVVVRRDITDQNQCAR